MHLVCCNRKHVRKEHQLPEELLGVGEQVEYFSLSLGTWVKAQVVGVNAAEGTYVLDNKGGPFASVQKIKEGFEAGVEYAVGEVVEYYSQSLLSWIPAQVLGSYGNGTYRLDCKPYASPEFIRRPKATPQSSDGSTGTTLKVGGKSADVRRSQADFCAGEVVEYHSKTQGGWIAAKVLCKNADGTYNLDVKPDAVPSKMRRQATAPTGLFQTIVPDYLLEPAKAKQNEEERDGYSCDSCSPVCPTKASNRFRLMCSSTPALMCPSLAPASLTDEHDYDHDGDLHFKEPMLSSILY